MQDKLICISEFGREQQDDEKENKKMMKEKLAVIESIQLIERQIADLIEWRKKTLIKSRSVKCQNQSGTIS